MELERKCKRCNGTEILIATKTGVVAGWKDKQGKRKDWFCPECDWGDDRTVERDV